MDTPRSGFRRATATSWALAGIGIAGVTGASTLAYADTVSVTAKPSTDVTATIVETGPPSPPAAASPIPLPSLPAAPAVTTTTVEPPAPLVTRQPVPAYTPEPTHEPAPVTHEAPTTKVAAPSTTKRRQSTPATVVSPNYSPHVTVSRGS